MAKSEGGRKPKLPDHGGDDKTYKPRSIETKVEHSDLPFPAHGGPKPMLNISGNERPKAGKH